MDKLELIRLLQIAKDENWTSLNIPVEMERRLFQPFLPKWLLEARDKARDLENQVEVSNLLETEVSENQIELTSLLEAEDLENKRITELPVELWELISLKSLDILNILRKPHPLPSEIGKLINLITLNLQSNSITILPPEIGHLKNLKFLDLSHNKIQELPTELFNLKQLERLNISDNELFDLPKNIGEQTNLTHIDLSYNKLLSLPVELNNLSNLTFLKLDGNPLPIPQEILSKTTDPRVILLTYFDKHRFLNESKVLIVGQGSVGKTSIIQRILHNFYSPTENKTKGIDIQKFKLIVKDNKYIINIWDFGGQEIMHATHQFFLTKRSLYILVLDSRLTQEENRVEYWLKIIQSFGGESPVLIVGNKVDQHPLDIDRTGLQKKYPNIVGILETSAATGQGIEELKTEITKQVDILPHVRDLLPETWFTVKSKMEELAKSKNFFTQDEYFKLCNSNEVSDAKSQHTLIGFLHDLGVVLHFQDDPRLENLGILNPQWVTNGVYKILNSHELFQNQGKLTLTLLNQILDFPEYPSNKRLFIVDMMKKFELCYDIEPDKSFLIPDLLPKDEPFTGEWKDALAFQIHYNILPSSIISRFIVRMNAFIHKTIWRSGVILKRQENTALVKADIEDKKIYIWVSGKEETRRDLLAIIRAEFEKIHQTIPKIEATEKVPVPDMPEAVPVDYEFLLRLEREGRESLPVQAGNKIVDLIVKEVLSRIESQNKNYQVHIHGDVIGGNIISGEKNRAKVENADKKKTRKKKS